MSNTTNDSDLPQKAIMRSTNENKIAKKEKQPNPLFSMMKKSDLKTNEGAQSKNIAKMNLT